MAGTVILKRPSESDVTALLKSPILKIATPAAIAELMAHTFTSKPVAPADWHTAKAEPAVTYPIKD